MEISRKHLTGHWEHIGDKALIPLSILTHLKKYNWIKKQILKAKISLDFPIYLHIEPTSFCNLRCSFCPSSRRQNLKNGYIQLDLYRKIIDECSEYKKLLLLLLHKDGESLLHPNLSEMIRYAKEKKAAKVIHLATNGTLMDENKAREIIDSGLDDVLISIDAATRATFLRLKGIDRLEEIEKNVKGFVNLRNKLRRKTPFVRVKMIAMEENQSELSLFYKKWKGIADRVEITKLCDWPQLKVNKKNKNNLLSRYPCTILWYSPAINWDGKVSICCFDADKRRIIGDVTKETLYNIWHSRNLNLIRKAHFSRNYDICADCSGWSLEPNLEYRLKRQTINHFGLKEYESTSI